MKPEVTANRTFVGSIAVVAASTAILPTVTGYGMVLFQIVVLNAWGLVAAATSNVFADQHHAVVWPVAAALNVVLFAAPASPVFWLLRRRAPHLCIGLLGGWLLFYLACLFFLFPATDGP